MRVLLINSSTDTDTKDTFATFPNGLLFLAAVLENNGHEVKIYDTSVDDRHPEDFVAFDPKIVGFSVLTGPYITNALVHSERFKKLLPEAKIVWGNVHASLTPGQVINESCVDYVIVGAGEQTLLELVEHLEDGFDNIEQIKGLVYKKGDQVFINEPRPFIENLDELPDPAWHLINVKKYWATSLNTSRGCPFHCSFCYNGPYHQGYRGEFSVDRIVGQVTILQKNYGVKYLRFLEDNFTANRKRLRAFCQVLIDKKIKLKWDCEARADLSESDIALMARAGCVAVGLGVETGSQRLLSFLKKDVDLARIEKTFWTLLAYKIKPNLYIMEALPGETIEDFNMTQHFLKRLDYPSYIYRRFVPSPGTRLFDYCVERGHFKPPVTPIQWADFSARAPFEINLSEVPTPLIDNAFADYAQTYTWRRLRFTLRHNPSYFKDVVLHPLEFIRALVSLFKCSSLHTAPIINIRSSIRSFDLPQKNETAINAT
ncbi:MAG: radical SAM protein [Dehalogenimonas sp.]